MEEQGNQTHLIVGLGNPGKEFDDTRHNIGFRALRAFAEKFGLTFKYSAKVRGDVAIGEIEGKKIILLLPTEYMNLSGISVKLCQSYYKIAPKDALVVCDDIAIPFATCRFRYQGSSGGHNGLKSVEAELGTNEYPRLRIGIGDREYGDLADYVLGRFTEAEKQDLPRIFKGVIGVLELWLSGGVVHGITASL